MFVSFRMLVLIVIVFLSGASAQTKSKPGPKALFTVNGDVARPLRITESDLAKLPRRTVALKDHAGITVTYEGIPLVEITRLARVPYGEDLKGKDMATYVVVKGSDKFRAIFALPELDPTYTDKIVILADKKDNQPLPSDEGPLRIITPDDKRQSRWVKRAVALTVVKSSS